jgi:hypothetical protein
VPEARRLTFWIPEHQPARCSGEQCAWQHTPPLPNTLGPHPFPVRCRCKPPSTGSGMLGNSTRTNTLHLPLHYAQPLSWGAGIGKKHAMCHQQPHESLLLRSCPCYILALNCGHLVGWYPVTGVQWTGCMHDSRHIAYAMTQVGSSNNSRVIMQVL